MRPVCILENEREHIGVLNIEHLEILEVFGA
jgi:hypothetical protein